jgi:hypothetical protein
MIPLDHLVYKGLMDCKIRKNELKRLFCNFKLDTFVS